MRRTTRSSLPRARMTYLQRKQAQIDAGADIEKTWNGARRTKTMAAIATVLASMAGKRQRCMYCADSRSTDIEHYWPKAVYRSQVFVWANLLWICAGCNRQKGNRFELDEYGQPLLIDPTVEDPWEFLFFDSQTGNVTARYDPATGQPNRKGAYTVHPATLPINIEPVTEGRQRTHRNLVRAVHSFLNASMGGTVPGDLLAGLLEAVRDNDDYGLAQWYFQRDGAAEEPFRTLRSGHPDVWATIAEVL